jgi:hypothetical protein
LLHLTGVRAVNPKYEVLGELSVKLDDLKRFRQLDSKCPGHPEYRWTSGVETTTGPLGQGVATSVGMAMAGRWAAATFNRPGFELFDYDVYALCGDGCGDPHECPRRRRRRDEHQNLGKKKWRQAVADVVARLTAALEADSVVLGGGNVKKLKELPRNCRAGDNSNAFVGGFRLWERSD